MPISTLKTSNFLKALRSDQDFSQRGFSLIEILVALVLAAMIFLAVPTNDTTRRHRELQTALDDIDRSIRFASNESVLRNSVVRLRISLEKSPIEYTVEYGPAGNLPLPDMPEKTSKSLQDEKNETEKLAALDRQFNKVEEFEDIKHEIPLSVEVQAIASTFQKGLIIEGEASLYFYPTGEKDGGLIVLSTLDEIAYLEVAPFLSETNMVFEPLNTSSVAKLDDIIQTKVDEVYKTWLGK